MKYFITGGDGFLGKELRERLKGDFYLYRRDQDLECLKRYQPDYIYHLAAEIYKDEEMFESNIRLTYNLLESSRNLNLKAFIHIGSSSEYGRKDHPMGEKDYLDPVTMYEATKGAATLLCQTYARTYGVPVVIARPFSLYGDHEPEHRFIPTVIKKARNDQTVSVAPGVHDFIHVGDFIEGLSLLEKNPTPGEIYNFGTGIQTSNIELVDTIEKIMGKPIHRKIVPKLREFDSDCWVADISKARSLGWKPKYTLESGLKKVIGG